MIWKGSKLPKRLSKSFYGRLVSHHCAHQTTESPFCPEVLPRPGTLASVMNFCAFGAGALCFVSGLRARLPADPEQGDNTMNFDIQNKTFLVRWMTALVVGIALSLSAFGGVVADEKPIEVTVHSIQIHKDGKIFDKQLEPLRDKLISGFPGYQNFKHISEEVAPIKQGGQHTFALPDKTPLTIGYSDVTKELINLNVKVDNKVATTLRVSRGNTFFQAGLPYQDGILVIAITVR